MNTALKIRPLSTPFALVLSLLALLGAFGLFSHNVKAQTLTTDSMSSGVSIAGTMTNISFGIPNQPDALIITCSTCISGSYTLLSTSTAYTILSLTLVGAPPSGYTDYYPVLYCGTNPIFPEFSAPTYSADGNSSTQVAYLYNSSLAFNFDGQIHCDQDLTVTVANSASWTFIGVQYVPYDTREHVIIPIMDSHFVIIAGYILAFVSMIFVIWLFRKRI